MRPASGAPPGAGHRVASALRSRRDPLYQRGCVRARAPLPQGLAAESVVKMEIIQGAALRLRTVDTMALFLGAFLDIERTPKTVPGD
jgi:hypothetical protein